MYFTGKTKFHLNLTIKIIILNIHLLKNLLKNILSSELW